jgi:integrase
MQLRKKVLTDFAVTKAKPKPEGYEISDGGQRGLRLVVRPSGVKSWIVRYRHPVTGVSRKLTLQPGISLAAARKLAADAMYQIAQGIDPIDGRRAEKQAAVAATEGTLAAIAKQYLALAASKLRSHDFYKGVLERHILPRLGERQVADLKRSEIVAALDRVESESGPSAADMALAVLGVTLSWHEKRSDTFRSPIIKGMRRVKASERARDRVLNDDEIKRVWQAAGDERIGFYGQVIRFMVLTGARRTEAAGLRRSEVETVRDNGTEIVAWRLPASRSKSNREVVRPLSKAALAIIEDQPMIGEDSDFVFTLDGNRAMSMNRHGAKQLLDQIAEVADWRLHDLRRVHRSLLSRCRVPFEVAERLLGHSQPLIAKTYDRHSHLPAMLEAVEKVAAEVERIVSGEGRVVRLVAGSIHGNG